MSTVRPSWPSSDLWRRVAADSLQDDSQCPACGCPAITHQRDALIGVLFCPAVQTDKDRELLWSMVKRTNAYKGLAGVVWPGGVTTNEPTLSADLDVLKPWLIPILSRDPRTPLQEAIEQARQARTTWLENETRLRDAGDEARLKALNKERVQFDYPPVENRPSDKARERLARRRGARTRKDDAPVLVVKRRYDLED